MKSIAAACEAGIVPAEISLVVSNKASAPGLEWAREQGIQTVCLSHKDYADRESHDRAVIDELRRAGVDWVCLAGYMRLLSSVFIDAFPNRILNIHPALLPSFPGLHGQEQAWEYGVKVSGCTVHLVDAKLDHGPIIVQRTVPVLDSDTADDLSQRILAEEHKAYPEALQLLLSNPWRVDGRRVVFE